jgi:predicted nucleotidyltransferase
MHAMGDNPTRNPAALAPPVDDAVLTEIVRRIVTRAPECCIVLFGSHAYGQPREDSDIDLLVITPTSNGLFTKAGEIYSSLSPRSLAIDVVVMTPEMYRQRRRGFDPFLKEVASRGRVLHGRLP